MYFKRGFLFSALLLSAGTVTHAGSMGDQSSHSMFNLRNGHGILQLGGYWSHQGKDQQINIVDLVGDDFTVTSHSGSNGLVGFGYFLEGPSYNSFNLSYGINAFYLPKTTVSGNVIQEDLFTNLSYQYGVTHFPVYVDVKATAPTSYWNSAVTLDVGIGPNFMNTRSFQEQSLDGMTLPDMIFSGQSKTTFSATAGIGVKFNNVIGNMPVELGYRFFYLGEGSLRSINSQVLNTLKTGTCYGNAIVVSATI